MGNVQPGCGVAGVIKMVAPRQQPLPPPPFYISLQREERESGSVYTAIWKLETPMFGQGHLPQTPLRPCHSSDPSGTGRNTGPLYSGMSPEGLKLPSPLSS